MSTSDAHRCLHTNTYACMHASLLRLHTQPVTTNPELIEEVRGENYYWHFRGTKVTPEMGFLFLLFSH